MCSHLFCILILYFLEIESQEWNYWVKGMRAGEAGRFGGFLLGHLCVGGLDVRVLLLYRWPGLGFLCPSHSACLA